MRFTVSAILCILAPTLFTSGADAQTFDGSCTYRDSGEELTSRASPPDSASVTLDGETVKICYSSPRVRGRTIFGELVPHGEIWRLGANEATRIWLPFQAELGGVELEAGGYALYTTPREDGWTFYVSESTDHWGRMITDEVRAQEVGEFTVEPEATEELVENFTIRLEPRGENEAHMIVEWEKTRLTVPLERSGS